MSPSTTRPRVLLLGTPQLYVDGDPVAFRTSKVASLLGYLAAHAGRSASRTSIAEALWPQREPGLAHHNLRQTLLNLRQALGETADDVLSTNRRDVKLRSEAAETDVEVFQRNAGQTEIDALRAAVEAYRGPFLAGIDDDWVHPVRAELSRSLVAVLLELSDRLRATDPQQALQYAERAIREEPFHDGARARKIRALRALGEETLALREFETYEAYLDEELGLRPARIVEEALSDEVPLVAKKPTAKPTDVGAALDVLMASDRSPDAVRLAVSLTPYWVESGQSAAGLAKLDETLSGWHDRESDPELWSRALIAVSTLALRSGANARSRAAATEALERLTLPAERAQAYNLLSRSHIRDRATLPARADALRALRLGRAGGASTAVAEAWSLLGYAHHYDGDTARAVRAARRAQAAAAGSQRVFAQAGILLAIAHSHRNEREEGIGALIGAQRALEALRTPEAAGHRATISRLFEEFGDLVRAEAGYTSAVEEFRAFDDPWGTAISLTYLGDLEATLGRPERARPLHEEARVIRSATDDRLGLATSLRGIGRASLAMGDWNSAREHLRESVRLFTELDDMPGVASCLPPLAQAERETGSREVAYRLAARAFRLLQGMSPSVRTTIGPQSERLLPEAEALMRELGP